MAKRAGRLNLLRQYAKENGWFLLFQRIAGAAIRRTRDSLLEKKLKTSGVKLGKHPRLIGLSHMRLGANFSAGNELWLEAVTFFAGVSLQPLLTVGANCSLSDNVHLGCTNQLTIGDGFLCGSRVIITDHDHGIYNALSNGPTPSNPTLPPIDRPLSHDKSVRIGNNVWVGDGVAILGGTDIGDGVIIGANAVVTGRIPSFTIAVGIPAKPVKRFDFEKQQWVHLADFQRR
jgi:acetyltransferase-like isoleucine patch superfamily enzyme